MVAFLVTVTLPGLFILFLACVGSRLIVLGKIANQFCNKPCPFETWSCGIYPVCLPHY